MTGLALGLALGVLAAAAGLGYLLSGWLSRLLRYEARRQFSLIVSAGFIACTAMSLYNVKSWSERKVASDLGSDTLLPAMLGFVFLIAVFALTFSLGGAQRRPANPDDPLDKLLPR